MAFRRSARRVWEARLLPRPPPWPRAFAVGERSARESPLPWSCFIGHIDKDGRCDREVPCALRFSKFKGAGPYIGRLQLLVQSPCLVLTLVSQFGLCYLKVLRRKMLPYKSTDHN